MKNVILLVGLFTGTVLMHCADKKTTNEKVVEQALASSETKSADEGVVIVKQTKEDTLKSSLKAYAKGKIGETDFKITYHSPSVRERIVWGGLVPYDRVWVTGAHMATTLESNTDFMFGEKVIPAGKYGLFTIPGMDTWTVIINKNWQQHLTDEYDTKEDVARVEIAPVQLHDNQERLQYEIIAAAGNDCTIKVCWEKLQLNIPITIVNQNPNFE